MGALLFFFGTEYIYIFIFQVVISYWVCWQSFCCIGGGFNLFMIIKNIGVSLMKQFKTKQRNTKMEIKCFVKSKLTLLYFIILCVALSFLPPASIRAETFSVKTGPNWITGYADMAPLSKVAKALSDQTGYQFKIDDSLMDAPISFHFPGRLPHEEAIKRMVRPHSYAMVLEKKSGDNHLTILEIKVFNKANKDNTRFVAIGSSGYGLSSTGGLSGSDTASVVRSKVINNGIPMGPNGDRGLARKDFDIRENAFGAPLRYRRDRSKGPDYRRSGYQIKKDYENYKSDKETYEKQQSSSEFIQARQEDYRMQIESRYYREASLQTVIAESD